MIIKRYVDSAFVWDEILNKEVCVVKGDKINDCGDVATITGIYTERNVKYIELSGLCAFADARVNWCVPANVCEVAYV